MSYSKGVTSICALTDQGVLYSVLRKGIHTSRESLLFLIDLERMLREKEGKSFDIYRKQLIIRFDNASIHTTDELNHFFRMRGI